MFNVQCSRFKVHGSRLKVQGSRFKVHGSRFEVQGLRFKVMHRDDDKEHDLRKCFIISIVSIYLEMFFWWQKNTYVDT